jgi:hypothetical protein
MGVLQHNRPKGDVESYIGSATNAAKLPKGPLAKHNKRARSLEGTRPFFIVKSN